VVPDGSVTAASIASEMAMPRLPGVSGISSRMVRPAWVSGEGEGTHRAPHVSIMVLRKGFWSKLTRTIQTSTLMPSSWPA
jgi:hypothetical protein